MAWQKAATETLTGTNQEVVASDQTARDFNTFMFQGLGTTGNQQMRLNGATGSVYSDRHSEKGAADVTGVNQTSIAGLDLDGSTSDVFSIGYYSGLATEEKLVMLWFVESVASGAGQAPNRQVGVGKFVNTSDGITSTTMRSTSSNDYDVDSNLTVLNTD